MGEPSTLVAPDQADNAARTAKPPPATHDASLQSTVGNQALANAAGSAQFVPLKVTAFEADETIADVGKWLALTRGMKGDAEFVAEKVDPQVWQPVAAIINFEDYTVTVNERGTVLSVVPTDENVPREGVYLREAATSRIWVLGSQNGHGRAQSFPGIQGGDAIKDVKEGLSVLLVFAQYKLLTEEKAVAYRKAVKYRHEHPGPEEWAVDAVQKLKQRRAAKSKATGGPKTTAGGEDPAGHGLGSAGSGSGGGGTGVDEKQPDTEEGAGPPTAKRPLRGDPKFSAKGTASGGQELQITLDRAITTVGLKKGEHDSDLDARIDKAIDDLQRSRDPGQSIGVVRDAAKETGFTDPVGKQQTGHKVDTEEAKKQAQSNATASTPGQKSLGGKGEANAPAYPATISMPGYDPKSDPPPMTVPGATNSFTMTLDYQAMSFGTADEVWNRLQNISFNWELLRVDPGKTEDEQKAQAAKKELGSGEQIGVASGVKANISRDLDNIAKDEQKDIDMMEREQWDWPSRGAYLTVIGVSNTVRVIGSLISAYVDLVTQPLNERSIGFKDEGEFVLRCVATPIASDEARHDPDHHVIRASSIAAVAIKVMPLNKRASQALEKEDVDQAKLEAAVAKAETDEQRDDAVKVRDAGRAGIARSGFEAFEFSAQGIRSQLRIARRLAGYEFVHLDPKLWLINVNGTEEIDREAVDLATVLATRNQPVTRLVTELDKQLKAFAGKGADEGTGIGEHEKWVSSQHTQFAEHGEFRPRVVLASEENGQVTPVLCMLGELKDSTPEHPKWRLVDITSPGSRDYYTGESTSAGDHSAAIHDAFRNFAENAGYGRGTIAIRLPTQLTAKYPGATVDTQVESAPGSWARAKQRLQDLATAAEVVGLFVTGPLGAVIGAIGGIAGATVQVDSLMKRWRTDHVWEVETIFDVLGVIGGAASVMGVGTTFARLHVEELSAKGSKLPSWVSKLERTESALHIYGRIGNLEQDFSIGYTLITELDAIDADTNLTKGQASSRRALAMLRAIKSGAVTVIQRAGPIEHDSAEGSTTKHPTIEVDTTTATKPATGEHLPLPAGTGAPDAHAHADGSGPAKPPHHDGGGAKPAEGEAHLPPTGSGATGETGQPRRATGDSESDQPKTPSADELVAAAMAMAEAQRRAAQQAVDRETVGEQKPGAANDVPATSTPPNAAQIDAVQAVVSHNGPQPNDAAQQVRPEATTSSAAAQPDALRLLHDGGDFRALRAQLDNVVNLSGAQRTALRARLQEARLAVTNEHLARVLDALQARFPDLRLSVQDLGTRGFASDRDCTIRATPADPAAYAKLPDAERAVIDRKMVQASTEAIPEIYKALDEAGFPADKALDSNFYTELHESLVAPADRTEALQISADQQVVSLTEIIMRTSPEQWKAYVEHQRAAIDALAAKGTPTKDVDALHQRLDDQVAAAEASTTRLLGGMPTDGGTTPRQRETALHDARRALVEALKRQPPASAREVRQLMADVKLLEPDAYGTRSAVTGVVLGGQAMKAATIDAVKADGFRTKKQIDSNTGEPGPQEYNPKTAQMEEASAESELSRRRADAAANVGTRRPGDATASAFETNAPRLQLVEAVIGHLLGHLPPPGQATHADAATVAKNLSRVIEACDEAGVHDPSAGIGHLPDIVAAKGAPNVAVAMDAALRGWAADGSVRGWAAGEGLALTTAEGRLAAFIEWGRVKAMDLGGRLRVRTETAAVHDDVPVGAGTTTPSRPGAGAKTSTDETKPAQTAEPVPDPTDDPTLKTATGTGGGAPRRPAPNLDTVANAAEYTRSIELLGARMGQQTATVPGPAAPAGRYGNMTRSAAEAVNLYDEAVGRAGNREVGLYFNMNTGEFGVTIGTEGSVRAPDFEDGWACVQHIHPDTAVVRRLRLPAPQDITGDMMAAARMGTFTTFIESTRPDGTRGRVRVVIKMTHPQITIEIPTEPGEPVRAPLEFASWDEYAQHWGGQTIYAEPNSPLYNDLLGPGGRSRGSQTATGTEAPKVPPTPEQADRIERSTDVPESELDPTMYEARAYHGDQNPLGFDEARYKARADIEDGVMRLDFILQQTVKGKTYRSKELRGRDEFDNALAYFRRNDKDAVKAIEGDWSSGDNIAAFQRSFEQSIAEGMGRDEAIHRAAMETPTGGWCLAAGYGRVQVQEVGPADGTPQNVRVHFLPGTAERPVLKTKPRIDSDENGTSTPTNKYGERHKASWPDAPKAVVFIEPDGKGYRVTDVFRGELPPGTGGQMVADTIRGTKGPQQPDHLIGVGVINKPTLQELADGTPVESTKLGKMFANAVAALGGEVVSMSVVAERGKTNIVVTIHYPESP